MQIIEKTLDFELQQKSAIAIGKFDGIHMGHQMIINEILEQKKYGMQAVIFTFEPSPQVLFGHGDEKQLMTKEEKRALFEQMGIDVLFEFPLTRETATFPPKAFIEEILVDKMKAGLIAAGTDLSFGDKGKGNCQLLRAMQEQFGYKVVILDKICRGNDVISSTLIRNKIENGEMEEAQELMGRPYEISGIVEPGKQIGRTISFPTLNLFPPKEKCLPPSGVYFSEISFQGEKLYGITNVGIRPTVSDTGRISVETYVFDFDREIYGEHITVKMLHHTRPEYKFDSVEKLKQQLELDKIEGDRYFLNEKKY